MSIKLAHISISDRDTYEELVDEGLVRSIEGDTYEAPLTSFLLIVPIGIITVIMCTLIIMVFFRNARSKYELKQANERKS